MGDTFIVVRLPDYYPPTYDNYITSNSAKNIAAYMWGRSKGKYLIYKNGRLVEKAHLFNEISELEALLESYY